MYFVCLFSFVCFVLRVKTSMIVFLSNPPSVMHLLVCGPLEFHAFVMYLFVSLILFN